MRRILLSTALSWRRLALTPKTNRCPDRKVEFRVTGVRCSMKADVWSPHEHLKLPSEVDVLALRSWVAAGVCTGNILTWISPSRRSSPRSFSAVNGWLSLAASAAIARPRPRRRRHAKTVARVAPQDAGRGMQIEMTSPNPKARLHQVFDQIISE